MTTTNALDNILDAANAQPKAPALKWSYSAGSWTADSTSADLYRRTLKGCEGCTDQIKNAGQ